MPIVIVHLGDLHIRNADDSVLMRVDQIVAAVHAQRLTPSACFVVVAGDIAFSGKPAEYKLAEGFFRELLVRLGQLYPGIKIEIVFVPGNHDCDLARASDIRKAGQIQTMLSSIDVGGAFVREYLEVQSQFFAFTAAFGQTQMTSRDRLVVRRTFVTDHKHSIAFTCYNTAWMSKNPEVPGDLYYPSDLHISPEQLNAEVEIAILHHPYHWLEPNNQRLFKDALTTRADVIITGHEHDKEQYTVVRDSGSIEFIAGQAMADPRAATNGFNVITIDLAQKRWLVRTLDWNESHYVPSNSEPHMRQFQRNKALAEQGFTNNAKFADALIDIGTGFTHPKKELRLPDLFVYPSLAHRDFQHKFERLKSPRRVDYKDTPTFILNESRLLLLGPDRCGKTSLAKTIYTLFQNQLDLVPIMVSGRDIVDISQLPATVDTAYEHQYSALSLERFRQLPPSRCALIVDDFDKSPLRRRPLGRVVEEFGKWFSRIVIIADQQFELEQVINTRDEPVLLDFRQYLIEEFSRVIRGKLIKKWVTVGRHEWDEDQLNHEIDSRERTVDTLLGKQLLPAYPIIVLSILQAIEVSRNVNTAAGSYGELYEALITERLISVSERATDLGTRYTLIARIAYFVYKSDISVFTRDNVNFVCDRYLTEYQIRIDPTRLIDDLLRADIFERFGSCYQFKYQYYYHFFVARYFRDNLPDPALSENLIAQLSHMVDRIYYDPYVNILIFYLYFTKDIKVIERILGNAEAIYSTYQPAAMETDVDFINRLYTTPTKPILLPCEDIDKNRDDLRQQVDDLESGTRNEIGDKLVYTEQLDDFVKINIAFKTIRLLGQVLRNFPGSLRRNIKVRIAEQCYLLGLRVLSFVLNSVEENADELRRYFSLLIHHRQPSVSAQKLGQGAEEAMIALVELWAYGIVKVLSHSIGMEDLAETYKEVAGRYKGTLSVQIIDASIKLDHFSIFPESQIDSLERRLVKNHIAFSVLRNLIAHYLYIFRSTRAIRQKYAARFEIDTKPMRYIEAISEKER